MATRVPEFPTTGEPFSYEFHRLQAMRHRTWLDPLQHGDVTVLHVGGTRLIFLSSILRAVYQDDSRELLISEEVKDPREGDRDWMIEMIGLAIGPAGYTSRKSIEQDLLDHMIEL